MSDIDSGLLSEVAQMKAQLAQIMNKEELELEVKTIWAVYDPMKTSVWCSKIDCPLLGRETTYDTVKQTENEDGELESVIETGLSEEETKTGEYDGTIKRVSSPRIKHHDLGIMAAFTSKKKATDFIEDYFKMIPSALRGKNEVELCLSEIIINS